MSFLLYFLRLIFYLYIILKNKIHNSILTVNYSNRAWYSVLGDYPPNKFHQHSIVTNGPGLVRWINVNGQLLASAEAETTVGKGMAHVWRREYIFFDVSETFY